MVMNCKTLCLAVLLFSQLCYAAEQERPFIWVKASDRPDILQKIDQNPWANELFQALQERADEATSDSMIERREKLMALPLVWSEQHDSTPTLRIYANKAWPRAGKDEKLKWGHPRAVQEDMMKGLQDGVDCGVLYYLTEEIQYAECAADILFTFVNALAKTEIRKEAPRDYLPLNGGWIYQDNHLLEARIVGAQIPIIYDFVYPYLKSGGQVYDLASGKLSDFDFDAAQSVFRTYISLALNKGLYDSNWPVLESSSLLHNILALDDEKERAEKLPYYLDKDTEQQASLNTVAKMYKNPGDIWPESLGYSRHVTTLSIYLMTALDRIYPELGLGKRYSNIPESLTAFYNLQFPNADYPFFGDGHRHYEVEYDIYEMALQLATINGQEDQASTFSDFLSSSMVSDKYDRGALAPRRYGASPYLIPLQLLWSLADLDGDKNENVEPPRPRTVHLPHAGMTIQRNISDKQPTEDSLMAFTAGGSYIHGHATGMDMELYGQGYVLGIDGGKGGYGTDMHENYYRLFAAHNSVISNGASGSQGGWVNMGINQVTPVALEPTVESAGVSPDHSFATSEFYDEFNLVAPADHERTIALIKLSDKRGYYLDIFRARSDTPAQFHDYVYHNIGDTLDITTSGETVAMSNDEDRYQASDQIPWENHHVYQHPGWHFFTDVESSSSSDGPYEVTFTASKLGDKPITMRALIPAGLSSEISQMNAPKSYGAAKPYNEEPLPTFALRHEGEAWSNPFAVVYESHTDKPAVKSVERLMADGIFKGVKVSSHVEGHELIQYVLMQESIDDEYTNEELGIRFKGRFGVITLEGDGTLRNIYIGNGHHLNYGDFTVSADNTTHAAFLEY